jgi:hypothetical protein
MQTLYSKSLLAVLLYSLFFTICFVPGLSYAYGGKHYGHYGYSGFRHNGYSRHYGYNKYGRHHYYPRKYYRSGHYNYPYRRYQKYPRSYSFSVPAYTRPNYVNNRQQQPTEQYDGIKSLAWSTLAQGKYNEALNIFAQEAQSHPDSGVPKVGFSLATAIQGNLTRGIWAMRRAFRIDPGALHYLQLDEKGRQLINHLIGQYSTQQKGVNIDHDFMLSALYYLQHDYDAAKKVIDSVDQYRDKSSSFINLKKLINRQLPGQEIVN